MKILNTLTKRHILMNRRRSLVTLIGITLTSSLLFAVGFIYGTYNQNQIKAEIKNFGNHDAIYQDISFNKKSVFENDDIDKYEYTSKLYDTDITWILNPGGVNERKQHVSIYTISPNFDLKIVKGRNPTNDKELAITEYRANKLNVSVGDKYKITITDIDGNIDQKEYTICGIYQSTNNKLSLSSLYSDISNSEGEKAFTKENINDEKATFYVYLKNKKDAYSKLEKIAEELKMKRKPSQSDVKAYENVNYNSNLLRLYGNYTDAKEYALILVSLMLILTVISIFCATLIYNSFAISLMERTKQIGMLKSVGTTNRQVRIMIFKEAIYLSIIAIPLGFMISYLLTSLVIYIINNLLSGVIDYKYVIFIYKDYVLMSLAFIILTVVYSVFFPSVEASRMIPIEAIRGNKKIKSKRFRKPNKIINKLFGISGIISYNSIKRNKSKYRVTTFAITVSFLLFMTLATYINFYQKTLTKEDDIQTGITIEADNEIINEIIKLDTVDDYIISDINWVYILNNNNINSSYTNKFSGLKDGMPNRLVLLNNEKYQALQKELNIKNDNPIYINYYDYVNYEDESKKNRLKIFDKGEDTKFCSYDLYYDQKLSKSIYTTKDCLTKDFNLVNKKPKTLSGFTYDFQADIIVNEEIFNQFEKNSSLGENIAKSLQIKTSDPIKIDKQIKEIYANSKTNQFYYYNYSLENYSTLKYLMVIKLIIYSLIILFSLVAITSIVNTIVANMSLRKREFAILKSVGLDSKQFDKMLLLEGLFLSIKSLVFAIPLSLYTTYLINKIFNIANVNRYTFKDIFALNYFILGIIMVFVIINMTIYLTTRRFKKQNIIEDVKNENI